MTTPPREWLDVLAANIEAAYDPKTATPTEQFLAVLTLKMHASLAEIFDERDSERTQHEATKSTLDKAWNDLRQARQMLADAPHDDGCNLYAPAALKYGEGCNCWKTSL